MTTPDPAEGNAGLGTPDTDLYAPPAEDPAPLPVTEDRAADIESADEPGRSTAETEA